MSDEPKISKADAEEYERRRVKAEQKAAQDIIDAEDIKERQKELDAMEDARVKAKWAEEALLASQMATMKKLKDAAHFGAYKVMPVEPEEKEKLE